MNGQAEESDTRLRVAVRGGGCSGFQYALAFDEQRDGDQVFEYRRSSSSIDSESMPFVDGSEVDYVEGLQGAGFAVNNPNVVASCGCGQVVRNELLRSCSWGNDQTAAISGQLFYFSRAAPCSSSYRVSLTRGRVPPPGPARGCRSAPIPPS